MTASVTWREANGRYLEARMAAVREQLVARASGQRAAFSPAEQRLAAAAAELPSPAALQIVESGFSLSPFESDVLVLCAAAELDPQLASLWTSIAGEWPTPTAAVALAALPGASWDALSPASALRHWHLVDVRRGDALASSELRLDERVLHFLLGVSYPEPRLNGIVLPAPAPARLTPSEEALAEHAAALAQRDDTQRAALFNLCGEDIVAQTSVAAAAAARLRLRLHVIDARDIPPLPADRELLARLWEREAVLGNGALLVDGSGVTEPPGALAALVEDLRGLVFVATREPIASRRRAVARIDLAHPTATEQLTLWRQTLGPELAGRLNGALDHLASQFRLGVASIREVSRQVQAGSPEDVARDLWDACRLQARTRLEGLARRIEPSASWNDLVLPEAQTRTLQNIVGHVRHRSTVYETWGFSRRGDRDLGITALFAGPSGTGKTMSAEVIAGELRLDLYRIDLSQMVSKYIGETEKHLRRVFDAGESGGAILLFDEADALFGRRSEVRDSHDRYANLEVSYLLQRMESYRGLAILTTNLKNVLDAAFLRRIRFVVNFPFPDAEQRQRIWQRAFPEGTPSEGLDYQKLARLNVAGGNIRNIALHAAFLAAEEKAAVRMRHLLSAAHVEFAKLEKPLTDNLGGGWM